MKDKEDEKDTLMKEVEDIDIETTDDEEDDDEDSDYIDKEQMVDIIKKALGSKDKNIVFNIFPATDTELLDEEGYQPEDERDDTDNKVERPEITRARREDTVTCGILQDKEKELLEYNKQNNPLGLSLKERILLKNIPLDTKILVLSKMSSSYGEDGAKNTAWVDNFLKLPVGEYKELPVSSVSPRPEISKYLKEARFKMDKHVFGMDDVKNEIMAFIAKKITNNDCGGSIIALHGPKGVAKCLGKGTLVRTFKGPSKPVEKIKIGDILMGDDNTPRFVLGTAEGCDKMYKVKQKYGENYVCNKEHILCLRHRYSKKIIEIPIKEYIKKSPLFKFLHRGYKSYAEYSAKPLLKSPYELGKLYKDRVQDCILYNDLMTRQAYLDGILNNKPLSDLFTVNATVSESLCSLITSIGYTILQKTENTLVVCNYQKDSDISVEFIGHDNYYGFEITGNARFLLNDYTVSHNTRIARKGIADALNLPFHSINCGGLKDSAILTGHDMTYVGSTYGKIAQILINSKCMNPVIYLDEIDKTATEGSNDIFGVLTHLLDEEQNTEFEDNYFKGVKLDLSRAIFVLSFNDIENVNAITADRMRILKIKPLKDKEKIEVCKNILIPEMLEKSSSEYNLVITEEIISYILKKTEDEDGMRKLRENLKKIIERLNLCYLSEGTYIPVIYEKYMKFAIKKNNNKKQKLNHQIIVNLEMIDAILLKDATARDNTSYSHMYL